MRSFAHMLLGLSDRNSKKVMFLASLGLLSTIIAPTPRLLDSWQQPLVGHQNRFQQLWKEKNSKYHNFLALLVWGKVILSCNDNIGYLIIFTVSLPFFIVQQNKFFSTPIMSSHLR